jgi:hypothetical protein
MEARIQQLVDALTASNTRLQQVEAAQQQQAQQAPPPPPNPPGLGVDTRTLGRPEHFDGNEKSWCDWSTVFRAYAGLVNNQLVEGLNDAEGTSVADVTNGVQVEETMARASQALYYMLVLLVRGEALNIVVNAGPGEGLLSWRRLVQRYEPVVKTRLAGLLCQILRWSFSGDIQARLELFERELIRWERKASEKISDQIRIGIVLNSLEEGSLRDHLVMNSSRLETWSAFKEEVTNIKRAQSSSGGIDPNAMDIGAFNKGNGKGGKGKGKKGSGKGGSCHNCGKPGHYAKDCRGPGGGGSSPQQNNDSSKGKGKKGSKGKGKTDKCYKCGGSGHFSNQCPTKGIHSFEEYGPEDSVTMMNEPLEEHGGEWDDYYLQGSFDLAPLDLAAVAKDVEMKEYLTVGVDTCAAVSILPSGMYPDYPIVRDGWTGTKYRTASNEYIEDEGHTVLFVRIKGTTGLKGLTFRRGKVSRPLLAVNELVKAQWKVDFSVDSYGKDISGMIEPKSGSRVSFAMKNLVYELELEVTPYKNMKDSAKKSFRGQSVSS